MGYLQPSRAQRPSHGTPDLGLRLAEIFPERGRDGTAGLIEKDPPVTCLSAHLFVKGGRVTRSEEKPEYRSSWERPDLISLFCGARGRQACVCT